MTKEIPVLKSFDTAEYALALMDDFKISHLPLLCDTAYSCLVSESDLLSMGDLSAAIGEPVLLAPSVSDGSHLYEALALITNYRLSLLPVVSEEGEYLGVITLEDLLEALAELCVVEQEGSVVVLDVWPQDYALSEIARLVESNNAHMLNVMTHLEKETGRLLVSMKVDLEDASPIIRSFERFHYKVRYHFMKKGVVDDVLRQRMGELLHYMNM